MEAVKLLQFPFFSVFLGKFISGKSFHMLHDTFRHEICQNFYTAGFSDQKFYTLNFNSFSDKDTKNEWNLHRCQNFCTAAGSDGTDKSHFWILFMNTFHTNSCLFAQCPWLSSSLSPGHLSTSNAWATSTSGSTSTSGRWTSTSSTSPAASTSSPPPSTRSSTTSWAPSTARPSTGPSYANPQTAPADPLITLVRQLAQIYLIGGQK